MLAGKGGLTRFFDQNHIKHTLHLQVFDPTDALRLKSLEEENRRLKCLVADLSLDNQVLKDLLEKNS
jgi:hypothetical protein